MKSKKIIEILQKIDPTGEIEVCVEGHDIQFIDKYPAYYDGTLQVLIRKTDPQNTEDEEIVGAKYVKTGSKIVIHTLSIDDYVYDLQDHKNKKFEDFVDYSELSEFQSERTKKKHQEIVENHRKMVEELEAKTFSEWLWKKIEPDSNFSKSDFEKIVLENIKQNKIDPDDPIDLKRGDGYISYVEGRYRQWDKRFTITVEQDWVIVEERPKNES